MKFYSVKKGRMPGIYTSWDECSAQVIGFSGAVYKSFTTMREAKEFLSDGKEGEIIPNCPMAYVDGSYNAETGVFGSGAIILGLDKEYEISRGYTDSALAVMHNVAGEIKAAELVMDWCVENGITEIYIYHDYEGIAAWAEGRWKANKEGTKAYKAYYDSISDALKVKFVKVKGHSGNKYNDIADSLAKKAAGI